MKKRLYDSKSSPWILRPVEWLGWKIEQLVWIVFHPKQWWNQRSAWQNARLQKNLLVTITLAIILYIGNALGWKVTSFGMLIGVLVGLIVYNFIYDALQAKIDHHKELESEAHIREEK